MKDNPLPLLLIAGGSSFILAFLSYAGFLQSIIALYSPALPLFLVGFSLGMKSTAISAAFALALLSFTAPFSTFLFYAAMIALPAILVTYRYYQYEVTMFAEKSYARRYPFGKTLSTLSSYAILVFLLVTLYYSGEGGLESYIAKELESALSQMPDDIAPILEGFSKELIYLIPFATVASWLIMLFGYGSLSQFILKSYESEKMPDFQILSSAHQLPDWVLLLPLASAIGVVASDGAFAFTSKVVLAISLLPYMMSGLNFIHRKTLGVPGRFLIIFMTYFLLMRIWPAVIIALIGVFTHVKEMVVSRKLYDGFYR